MTINCVRFVFHDILYILQGDWLTKEYNRLNEERRKAGDTVNPEPTFDEILKQERMPQNLEGYIDPIKMWVKYDGESKVPGALTDFLYLRKGFLHVQYSNEFNYV